MDNNACVKAHDNWASEYDSYDKKPFFQFLSYMMNVQIYSYIPCRGRILDAAGGTGTTAIALAMKGYDVVMTELSDSMIEIAKSKAGSEHITIVKSDLMRMKQFEDNEFDFSMVIGNALSYCKTKKALQELQRVTKQKGYILFDVHSFYQLEKKCIINADMKKLKRLHKKHLFNNGNYDEHGFTIEEIETLISECGLELIEIFGKMVLPNILNTDTMNEILKDKKVYKELLDMECKVFKDRNYLTSALELGVICRVK